MKEIITDPEILGGTPVFRGTRVPVKTLFDYLVANETLAEFLEDFPTVSREQADVVIGTTQYSAGDPHPFTP